MANDSLWYSDGCLRCGNLCASRTQVVVATPCLPGGLLAVGEAPGEREDLLNEGFVGTAGKTLDRLLADAGLQRGDYGRANICRCRPPGNRKPTAQETSACLPFLAALIRDVRPKVILAVGGTPTSVFCGRGTLHAKLLDRLARNDWTASLEQSKAHPGIQEALNAATYVVPMPHTSPLAFNRFAPSGEKWAVVAQRQVKLAVSLLQA